ncbi:unnamed protein product [marine sediment metagenome]|uniref:Uncharacterized protein n=1 Tax=marine sediment metagenome TaxID=412755 RepID=X1R8Z9_9ZZZZ
MVPSTVGANVGSEKKARLIEAAGSNGKNVNQVLNDFIDGYINNHENIREKIDHPEKTVVKPEFKTLKIETAETADDIDPDDFVEEMWDSFVAYAKDQGYSLIKTDHLTQLLNVIELRKGDRSAKKSEADSKSEPLTCGKCGAVLAEKFDKSKLSKLKRDMTHCPECGAELNFNSVSGAD